MIRFETCEEYVLNELYNSEQRIEYLFDECDRWEKEVKKQDRVLDTLRHFLKIRRAADGRSVIDMKLIFEEFDPEAFKIVKDAFELQEEET